MERYRAILTKRVGKQMHGTGGAFAEAEHKDAERIVRDDIHIFDNWGIVEFDGGNNARKECEFA